MIVGATLGRSYTNTLKTAGQQAGRLGEQWKKTNARLHAAGDVVKYRTRLDELRKKQQALGRSSERLSRGIEETERLYRGAKRAAKQYGIAVADAADEHRRLARSLKRTEDAQRRLERRQDAAGRLGAMRGAALGLAGAAYGAGRLAAGAMAREEQALYLRSVIGAPDRDAAVGRAVAHAREYARGSLASEEELLEIQYQLSSAGLQEEAARSGSEVVHQLAKVTRGAAGQVAEVFGITFNNMMGGVEGTVEEKMARVGNVLAKTQMKYQFRDFGQLGESMSTVAGSATIAGLSFEATAAAMGVLNDAGRQGSEAGTAFDAVLGNLSKASEKLGTDIVRDAAGELDLVATLQQIKDATDALDTDARADLLREIFGDQGVDAIAPLLAGLDKLRAGITELRGVAGSNLLSDEYQPFLDSAAGQWKMLTQNVTAAGQAFAGVLLPGVNRALSWLVRGAAAVGSWIEQTPALAWGLGAVATAFTAVGVVAALNAARVWAWTVIVDGWAATANAASATARGLAGAVGWVSRALRRHLLWSYLSTPATKAWAAAQWLAAGAGSALARGVGAISRALRLQVAWAAVVAGATKAWTAAQWLLNIALNANPIGLVVAGAAALVGVGYLVYRHWDKAKSLFSAFWPVLLALTGPLGVIVGAVIMLWKHWDKVTGAIGRTWEAIKKAPGRIGRKLLGLGDQEVGSQVGAAVPPEAAPTPGRVAPAAAAATFAAATIGGAIVAPPPGSAAVPPPVVAPAEEFPAAEFPALTFPAAASPAAQQAPSTTRTVVIRVERPVIEVRGDLDPEGVAELVQREFDAIMRRAAAEADLAEDDG